MSWRLALSTGVSLTHPIADVLDAAAAAGIQGVELATPPTHFDPWQESQVEAVGARLARNGLRPVSIHAPFGGLLDLSAPNPHHRHAALGAILATVSALKRLGGPLVVVHTSDAPREPSDVDDRLTRCADSLRVLAHACSHMGMQLAVETPLPHLVGGHPDEFAWILGRLDSKVGVCLDTGHVWLGHAWSRFVELAAGRVIHVHASDNGGRFDDHLLPGDGVIDWRRVARDLRRIDFTGWIVLELQANEEPLDRLFARACREVPALLV
jgi:sugar phosphate isomerase/epimerase